MAGINVFMYDNGTGRDIPSKVGTFPVEVLLGSSVSEIHSNINNAQLFCVFTHIQDFDIVVSTDDDKEILSTVLSFNKRSARIGVRPESIWYSKNANRNIVISDSFNIGAVDLSVILSLYLKEVDLKEKQSTNKALVEMYTIVCYRNGRVILKTPRFDEAKRVCDAQPASHILNRANEIVYNTKYGKVPVRRNIGTHTKVFKASLSDSNGVFAKLNIK